MAVYQVGKSIIFVPSFFKNNKLRTGDIMFLAQTQQFLPLSDPWLAWLKNKDLNEVGEQVPAAYVDVQTGVKGTTIRDMSDPILKTASVYIRGLLHTEPDMKKRVQNASLLETALTMGKEASEVLLDNLIKNTDFLNASLAFYSGDELDTFAKKASEMAESERTIELILPLDKAAKTLNSHELKALYKDGFFIRKKAAEQSPDVIRSRQLKGMFQVVKAPGKYKMLRHDGTVEDEIVFQKQDTPLTYPA